MSPYLARCAVAAAVVAAAGALVAVARGRLDPPDPSSGGPVAAVAAVDGRPDGVRWRWRAPTGADVGVPASDADGVVAAYGAVGVVALDHDGDVAWDVRPGGLTGAAPLVDGDLVVVPTRNGIAALDRATGAQRWRATTGARATTPAAGGDAVVFTSTDGRVVAVERADGRPRWEARLPHPTLAAAAVHERTGIAVVTWQASPVPAEGAGLVALDLVDGGARWTVDLPGGATGAPAVVGPADAATVVVVAGDLTARAFDATTGQPRWSTPVTGAGDGETAPVSHRDDPDHVLVADRLAGLFLLRTSDGDVVWHADLDGAVYRNGPAILVPGRRFALPLVAGETVVTGPGRRAEAVAAPGPVTGVTAAPDGGPVVATRRGRHDASGSIVRIRPGDR